MNITKQQDEWVKSRLERLAEFTGEDEERFKKAVQGVNWAGYIDMGELATGLQSCRCAPLGIAVLRSLYANGYQGQKPIIYMGQETGHSARGLIKMVEEGMLDTSDVYPILFRDREVGESLNEFNNAYDEHLENLTGYTISKPEFDLVLGKHRGEYADGLENHLPLPEGNGLFLDDDGSPKDLGKPDCRWAQDWEDYTKVLDKYGVKDLKWVVTDMHFPVGVGIDSEQGRYALRDLERYYFNSSE